MKWLPSDHINDDDYKGESKIICTSVILKLLLVPLFHQHSPFKASFCPVTGVQVWTCYVSLFVIVVWTKIAATLAFYTKEKDFKHFLMKNYESYLTNGENKLKNKEIMPKNRIFVFCNCIGINSTIKAWIIFDSLLYFAFESN